MEQAFADVLPTEKFIGVNAFVPEQARHYVSAGASFVLVGADVALLARGSEALAEQFASADGNGHRESY